MICGQAPRETRRPRKELQLAIRYRNDIQEKYARAKQQSQLTIKDCCFLWYSVGRSQQDAVPNWYCFNAGVQ
jgi:hypothetical protein